jgi:transitional endoplasmic reticulum ATPase
MALWRVREFRQDDLDALVRVWDDPHASDTEPVFRLSELLSAVRAGQPTVVATVGDEVVAGAVATVGGEHAWVLRLGLATEWRQRGIGSALLTELERRCFGAGARRLRCLLTDPADVGGAALEHRGFRARPGLVLYEKAGGGSGADKGILDQLGARRIPPGLWEAIGGMAREKGLIERQVILPLAHPEPAERSGLVPPRAIVLFGPPGTGKTTFAQAVAGRLGWPFIELFPSRLGTGPAGSAAALRDAFALVEELDRLVLFIDEVEEIAGRRDGQGLSPTHGLTNEMLKLIPLFRERDGRLLVCATNSVRGLDAALLRHGRFDYVIPVGPPDAAARRAIWSHYLRAVPHEGLDLDAVVDRSDVFTPADIEFAARRAAQAVFERSVLGGDERGVDTADVLRAVDETRPTLTPRIVEEFDQDIDDYARF